MAERMDYVPTLPISATQRDARNLLAWAQRIMAGGYGKPGSKGFRSATDSWQANYLPWRAQLPPMPEGDAALSVREAPKTGAE